MLPGLEDARACTLLQLLMDSLGLVTVRAWQAGDRWILVCDQVGSELALLLFVASDHVVEDHHYSMPGVSSVEERLVARLAPGTELPTPVGRALWAMEAQGWGGTDAGGDPFVTPYEGEFRRGAVFSGTQSTDGWLDPTSPDAWRLLPLAETDGSGGFAALWFAPSGDFRFVLLGSEGGAPQRLADDPVDFLRLIAIGYDELTPWVWDEPVSVDEDDEDTAAAHAPFRAWVEDEFEVEVPESWSVTDDERFAAWLSAVAEPLTIDESWTIIERVLEERSPAVFATLRGPASQVDLDELTRTVGHPLPEDLVASLLRHDGQDNPTQLLDLVDHHTLLSVRAMIEQSDLLADSVGDDVDETIEWMEPDRVRAVANCRGWLQFTSAEGQGHAIDLDPLPAGETGQIIHLPVDGPTPLPEYSSYRVWLSDLARRLEAGAFTVDDGGVIQLND
jgi:cell wall assembly regulator SMI1